MYTNLRKWARIISILFCSFLLFFIVDHQVAFADTTPNVYIDQNQVNLSPAPFITNGVTYLPLRQISEAFGFAVLWQGNDRIIELSRENEKLTLDLKNGQVYASGQPIQLTVHSKVIDGTTYIPAREMGHLLSADVRWNPEQRSVYFFYHKRFLSHMAIPVIMYHHLAPNEASDLVVSPERFKEHMMALHTNGYEPITTQDLLAFTKGEKPLPARPILITFDDGYESNYTYAYPILKELQMKATAFIVVSERGKQPGLYRHFSWEQASEMVQSGVMDIQVHAYTLHGTVPTPNGEAPAFTNKINDGHVVESDAEYENRIRTDLTVAKREIETNLGQPVTSFAYPFGSYNDTTERIAKELGYTFTFTIQPGVNDLTMGTHLLKRINVSGFYTGEDLIQKLKEYE